MTPSNGQIQASPKLGRLAWLFARENLLAIYLLAVGLNSLVFYLAPSGFYDHRVNLAFSVACFALLPLTRWARLFVPLVNASTWMGLGLVVFVAVTSGGVNSTVLVWLNLLALPVLMLRGAGPALRTIVGVLLTILALFVATEQGWISSHPQVSLQSVPWSVMQNVMALLSLMLCVYLFDLLHERQLRRLNQGNEALKKTHEALIQAQAHKDEFVAAVGHELRTPMNAILGLNGVLREELADRPDQVEVVDHIRRSTQHLLQVVNDILDFSQLQAQRLALKPVDFVLRACLDDVLAAHQARADQKGIGLHLHLDPQLPFRVHGDPLRLQQILNNLLDNALKFTAEGGVQLNVQQDGEMVRFEVIDSGRGIAQAQQAFIFRRFEHADVQTTRTHGGTGLGLSICEKLVLLQGGQIGVSSQEDQGSTFWFALPLTAAEQASEMVSEVKLVDQALRILVVDDNALNLMVAKLQLQKCWPQADITTADSAAKALVALDEQTFDVALVDMIMPDVDGLALTRHLRRDFPAMTAQMPIIALTANTNPVDRQKCLDAGMADVMDKPMDLDKLVRCVSQHIHKARGSHHA
jgi:signal transduction histidine kinase/ActR/RegA family two-component response regulator